MKLVLKRGYESRIKYSRHPWIFRSAVEKIDPQAENGSIISVFGEGAEKIGQGFYSTESKIACRMIDFSAEELSPDWLGRRLHEARALRERLSINSNAYRLVNAEGDYIPGLIIDVYNRTIVVRPLIRGIERLIDGICLTLESMFPGCSIYLKRDEKASRVERLELSNGYLSGAGEGMVMIEENSLKFNVDVREGQKTGFYLDQRENRALLGSFVQNRRVLNLFAYSGAFSLVAVKHGALAVDSVDSSPQALSLAERNYLLNGFSETDGVRWIRQDGFDFLARCKNYDIIICDPPPFARSRSQVQGALTGYRKLNTLALARLEKQGILFTFSCSGAVSSDMFKETLFEAGVHARKDIRIIASLHAASDHPYTLLHPEGEYLKGFVIYAQ